MSHAQIQVSNHYNQPKNLNSRIGRVIAIPEPILTRQWTVEDMLNDIPKQSMLAEIFLNAGQNFKQTTGQVLEFVKRS